MTFVPFPNHNVAKAAKPQETRELTGRLFTNSVAGAAGATEEQPLLDVTSYPPFDVDAALARVAGDRELLRGMVGLFALQWKSQVAEIAKAGQRHDGATLELTADKLKRSLESLGARAASRVALQLEASGRRNDFHDVENACARLEMEIERLVNALKEFVRPASGVLE